MKHRLFELWLRNVYRKRCKSPKKVMSPQCLKWIEVIQLYFKFLINKKVRQHSASALLIVFLWRGFSRQESIDHYAPAPVSTQKECILNPVCAAVLFPWWFFHAPTTVTTWQELDGIFDSTLPLVDWVCISRDAINTCSTVQSRCCSEKMFILPISPECSWMPILSCSHTGEFNSYPGNVVNQLEVLVPWGYSH